MSINPYESPAAAPELKQHPPPDFNAGQRTDAPGLILAILGGISFVLQALNLVVRFAMMGFAASQAEFPEGEEAFFAVGIGVGAVLGVAILISNAVTFWGGLQMRKLESYNLALAAAILAIIPCCSPCTLIGIPFGIWGLVVLLDPQVKAAFRN